MGANVSSLKGVKSSAELRTFLNDEELADDTIHNLLKFQIKPPKTIEECKLLVESCTELKKEITTDNAKNLTALVAVIVSPDISMDADSLGVIYNGLFFVKWFCLTYSDDTDKLLDVKMEIEALIVPFLIKIITNIEIADNTYHILMEASDLLTILIDISPKIDLFENEKNLITYLIKNFINQQPAPVFPFGQPSGFGHALASGMWSVMTVGMGSMNESVDPLYKPLSHSSIALLVKLVSSYTLCNSALCNMNDSKETNFSDLHYLLLANEEFTPFLKQMLRSNITYRKFVVMATDLSLIIAPVLKDIYNCGDEDYNTLSDKFELLQILAKDELFNQAIHSSSKSGSIIWYKEKLLKNIKLGGLVVIVLLRSVLQNKYDTIFQKTCMNILVQMSGHFSLLDLYPSERLVGCLEFLLKKHSRLVLSSEYLDASNVEDLVKNLLVIINSALVNQTQNNPNLVYSLLYKRELISSYTKQNEEFVQYFLNVENLLDFTSTKIEEHSDDPNGIMDTSVLLTVIHGALSEYPTERFMISNNKEVTSTLVEENIEIAEAVAPQALIVKELDNEQEVFSEDFVSEATKEEINQPVLDEVIHDDADMSINIIEENDSKSDEDQSIPVETIDAQNVTDESSNQIVEKEVIVEEDQTVVDEAQKVVADTGNGEEKVVTDEPITDTNTVTVEAPKIPLSNDVTEKNEICEEEIPNEMPAEDDQTIEVQVSHVTDDSSDKIVEMEVIVEDDQTVVVEAQTGVVVTGDVTENVVTDEALIEDEALADTNNVTAEAPEIPLSSAVTEKNEMTVEDDKTIEVQELNVTANETTEQEAIVEDNNTVVVEAQQEVAESGNGEAKVATDEPLKEDEALEDTKNVTAEASEIPLSSDETEKNEICTEEIKKEMPVEEEQTTEVQELNATVESSDKITEKEEDQTAVDEAQAEVIDTGNGEEKVVTDKPLKEDEAVADTNNVTVEDPEIPLSSDATEKIEVCTEEIKKEMPVEEEQTIEVQELNATVESSDEITEKEEDQTVVDEAQTEVIDTGNCEGKVVTDKPIKEDEAVADTKNVTVEAPEIPLSSDATEKNEVCTEEIKKEIPIEEEQTIEVQELNKTVESANEIIEKEEDQTVVDEAQMEVTDTGNVEEKVITDEPVTEDEPLADTNNVTVEAPEITLSNEVTEKIPAEDEQAIEVQVSDDSSDKIIEMEVVIEDDQTVVAIELKEVAADEAFTDKKNVTAEAPEIPLSSDVTEKNEICEEETKTVEDDQTIEVQELNVTDESANEIVEQKVIVEEDQTVVVEAQKEVDDSGNSEEKVVIDEPLKEDEVVADTKNVTVEAPEIPLSNETQTAVVSIGNGEDKVVKEENYMTVAVEVQVDESTEVNDTEEIINNLVDDSQNSSMVEFQAVSAKDQTPVTFFIDSKMLDKILNSSESSIIITNLEVLPSSQTRSESADSALFSGTSELDSNTEEQKAANPDNEIYKEFADQQRKISFAQIHNDPEKAGATKPTPRTVPVEGMSANLFLAGSNIKFDHLDEKLNIIGSPVSPCANVIWKRSAMV